MSDFNLEFAEIFGATDVRSSLGNPQDFRDVPTVPFLEDCTPLGEYGAADELCRKLEADAIRAELIGDVSDLAGEVLTPSQRASIDAPSIEPNFDTFIKNTIRYTECAAQLDQQEPRRKRELHAIFDRHLGAFHPDPELLRRCVDSATKMLRGILMEVA